MTKKRELMFSIVRGLLAILIALLVATLLIFISANGESVSEKLSSTGDALKQMLVGPLFRMGKNGTRFETKRLTDILASMIPIIFTGLSVSAHSSPAWRQSICRWQRGCTRSSQSCSAVFLWAS